MSFVPVEAPQFFQMIFLIDLSLFVKFSNSSTTIELMPNWKVDLRTTPTITTTGDQLEARAGVSGSADISLAGNNRHH